MPAGPINSVADVFADPQVLSRGMRVDLAGAGRRAAGAIPGVRSPIVIDGVPAVARAAVAGARRAYGGSAGRPDLGQAAIQFEVDAPS